MSKKTPTSPPVVSSVASSDSVGSPSKASIKRDLAEIFAISEGFLSCSKQDLLSVGFSDLLVDDIVEAGKMRLAEARKRQIKYIAKQLRDFDLDKLKEISEFLITKHKANLAAGPKKKETKVDLGFLGADLIEGGNDAIQRFCEKHPSTDRQHLRNLVRNAIKHKSSPRKAHFYQELELYLQAQ